MAVMKSLGKKFLKGVVAPYLALYILTSGYAAIDYRWFNPNKEEQNQAIALHIRRYKARVDGVEKYLTLVGETHVYNKAEARLGRRLVNEHTSFADEVGSDDNDLPFWDDVFNSVIAELWRLPVKFEQWGNGRRYARIATIAERRGHKVHALEENTYSPLSPLDRAKVLAWSSAGFLTAPLHYPAGRYEDPSEPCLDIGPLAKPLVTKRDPVMSRNLAGLLKQDDVDKLLASIGSCHLPGVIKNLEKELELQEIK